MICTELIDEARKVHDSFPVPTAALGRALIGAGLLASFFKDEGRIGMHFKGDGPLGPFFAEGNAEGGVRGFISQPQIHVPSKGGKLAVGDAVGKGILTVATSLPDEKHPYTGSVDIQTGEIGEDIAYYLFQSQQIPSIVGLGVFVEPDYSVSAAGGFVLQAMPGVKPQTLQLLENRVKLIPPVTETIRAGARAEDLAYEILEDFNFREVQSSVELRYRCHCSRDRVDRALLLMGANELKTLVEKNESTEVRCDFCGRKYQVSIVELKALAVRSKNRS